MKKIMIVLLLASAGVWGEPKKIYGLGAMACGDYLKFSQAIKQNPDFIYIEGFKVYRTNDAYRSQIRAFHAWAFGYASAIEQLTPIRGQDINEIIEKVDTYCKNNPDNNYIESLKNLIHKV